MCKSIEAFSPYLSIQVSALLRKKRGLVRSVWSVLGAGKGSLSSIVQYLCDESWHVSYASRSAWCVMLPVGNWNTDMTDAGSSKGCKICLSYKCVPVRHLNTNLFCGKSSPFSRCRSRDIGTLGIERESIRPQFCPGSRPHSPESQTSIIRPFFNIDTSSI